jgi:hypothetical protein
MDRERTNFDLRQIFMREGLSLYKEAEIGGADLFRYSFGKLFYFHNFPDMVEFNKELSSSLNLDTLSFVFDDSAQQFRKFDKGGAFHLSDIEDYLNLRLPFLQYLKDDSLSSFSFLPLQRNEYIQVPLFLIGSKIMFYTSRNIKL